MPFQAPPSPFPWKKASEALGRRQAVECPVCSPTGIWQGSSLSATLGCDGRKRVSARRDSTRMGSLWGEGAAPQSLLEEGHLGLLPQNRGKLTSRNGDTLENPAKRGRQLGGQQVEGKCIKRERVATLSPESRRYPLTSGS